MRILKMKKNDGEQQGYIDFCNYALASNAYNGPELLKMLFLRDKIKDAKHNKNVELEENEYQMLKQIVNKTQWAGAAADMIGPFLNDVENAPLVDKKKDDKK